MYGQYFKILRNYKKMATSQPVYSIPCKSAMIRGKAVLMIVLSRPDMTFDNIKATVITRLR